MTALWHLNVLRLQGTAAGHIDSSGQGLGGGGLYLNKTAGKSTNLVSIILFNSSLQANSAYGSGAHDDGGGMYVDAADVVRVVHSEFRDNSGRPVLCSSSVEVSDTFELLHCLILH